MCCELRDNPVLLPLYIVDLRERLAAVQKLENSIAARVTVSVAVKKIYGIDVSIEQGLHQRAVILEVKFLALTSSWYSDDSWDDNLMWDSIVRNTRTSCWQMKTKRYKNSGLLNGNNCLILCPLKGPYPLCQVSAIRDVTFKPGISPKMVYYGIS